MHKLSIFIIAIVCMSGASAQENLIRNGNFSDSANTHWSFESNGASASGSIDMGRFAIDIQAEGNKEARPQLIQRGIELKANEGYIFSFKASASDSSSMRVYVVGDNNALYSDSSEGIIKVSNTLKAYSLSFFVPRASGNAKVIFSCPVTSNKTRYTIDSVSLVKDPVPVIRVVQPSSGSRWIAGTERQIEWNNSGILDKVTLRYSSDNGKTWSNITSVASNQKSFWWQIPTTVFGDSCRIIVSDTSKTIADTTELFRIIAAGSIDSKEMVKNGTFLDSADWRLEATAPAKARGSLYNDSEYVISIDTMGEKAWQVKLLQSGLTLENGTMYRFSFDAYASHDRGIYANVGADNGNPAWSVYGGDTIPVNITTAKTRYHQTIIMKYPTSGNIRIEFNCGNDTGKVYIDNVSLIKLENKNVYIFSPSLASVLKSGARFNIEWHAEEISTINLDLSCDSGDTWVPIFEEIDNLGVVSWVVPEVSSDKCFIRIKRAAYDSVLGLSSQFVINAFGTPVKTGELMVNGSFANDLKGWNTSFNNAQGQAFTTDQTFKIDITQPGENIGTIILSQTGIPVLKGKEYTLSFDAFANGTRSMGLAVISEKDSSLEMDTVFALPAVEKHSEFKFTANKDAIVRVEFQLGGSRAGVFIDNVSFYTGVLVNTAKPLMQVRQQASHFSALHQGHSAIAFVNCSDADGCISVFTLQGALVYRTMTSGNRTIWNRMTQTGRRAIDGSYIAVLATPKARQTCSFILR